MKKTRNLPVKAAFVLLGLTIAVLLVLTGFVYRAHSSRLQKLSTELATKQAELATAKSRIAGEPRLRREYESLRAALATLEPAVATSAYVPTFLGQLEQMGSRTGNTVTGVKPDDRQTKAAGPPTAEETAANAGTGPAAPAPGSTPAATSKTPAPPANPAQVALSNYERLPIEVTMAGNFWSTVAFLREMASFPKLVAVREVTMAPENRGDTAVPNPVLNVKVNLLALVHKGEDEWKSVARK